MKIRTGFVSNSSSSSFCAFGKVFHLNRKDEVDEFNTVLKALGSDIFVDINDKDKELELWGVGDKHNITMLYDWECEMVFWGREYSNASVSMTFGEFQEAVIAILGDGCKHINQIINSG